MAVENCSSVVCDGLSLCKTYASIVTQILPTAMSRVEEEGGNGNSGVIGDITHPIKRGMIKDWDAMEDLWRYVFYTGLGWEPGNEGQLLVAEPLLTSKVLANHSFT